MFFFLKLESDFRSSIFSCYIEPNLKKKYELMEITPNNLCRLCNWWVWEIRLFAMTITEFQEYMFNFTILFIHSHGGFPFLHISLSWQALLQFVFPRLKNCAMYLLATISYQYDRFHMYAIIIAFNPIFGCL